MKKNKIKIGDTVERLPLATTEGFWIKKENSSFAVGNKLLFGLDVYFH